MKINSIKIILNKFKENLLTEEEAISLVEDIYDDNRMYYYPYWTYSTNNYPPKYDVTCNYENNKMSKM